MKVSGLLRGLFALIALGAVLAGLERVAPASTAIRTAGRVVLGLVVVWYLVVFWAVAPGGM